MRIFLIMQPRVSVGLRQLIYLVSIVAMATNLLQQTNQYSRNLNFANLQFQSKAFQTF